MLLSFKTSVTAAGVAEPRSEWCWSDPRGWRGCDRNSPVGHGQWHRIH